MKSYSNWVIFSLTLIVLFTVSSCNSDKTYSGKKEGRIIYDVTYPLEQPSLMLEMFPKELNFYFKGDLMSSELKSSYDLISSGLIIDNDKRQFVQLLKNMGERSVVSLKENEARKWLDQHSNLRMEVTKEEVEIIGKKCYKVLAHFDDNKTTPLELFVTKEMDLSTNNWWNQFKSIDGFLLGYDVEMYGKRMRVRAREVKYESISDMKFRVPVNYEEVTENDMQEKMLQIVREFIG